VTRLLRLRFRITLSLTCYSNGGDTCEDDAVDPVLRRLLRRPHPPHLQRIYGTFDQLVLIRVATGGQNFGCKNQKGPKKLRGKSGAEFYWQIYTKKSRKGAELFLPFGFALKHIFSSKLLLLNDKFNISLSL
jgi:hypothetical protein